MGERTGLSGVAAGGGAVFARYARPASLWRSDDEGATWVLIETDLSQGFGDGLEVDPRNPRRVWLTASRLGVLVGDFDD